MDISMKKFLSNIALVVFVIIQFVLYVSPSVLMLYGVFVLFKGCGDSNDDNQEARIERLQKEITDITTDINIDYAEYNYAECKDKCNELIRLCNEHADIEHIDLAVAPAHLLLGKMYYDEADYDAAKVHLLKSTKAFDQYKQQLIVYGVKWYYETITMQYLMLCDITKQQESWEECNEYMENIMSALKKADCSEAQQLLPMFIVKYGHMASHFLDYAKAEKLYKEVIDNSEIYSKYIDYDKYCTEAYHSLISIYVAQLQPEKALALYDVMLRNECSKTSDNTTLRCSSIVSIALCYIYQNNTSQAMRIAKEYQHSEVAKYGSDSVQSIMANACLANIRTVTGLIDGNHSDEDIAGMYEDDIKFWTKKNQYSYPQEYRWFITQYSELLIKSNRCGELGNHCCNLMNIYSSSKVSEEYIFASLLYAECLVAQSKLKEAEGLVDDVCRLIEDNHLYIYQQLESSSLLASIYEKQGRTDDSKRMTNISYRLIVDFPLGNIQAADPLGYAKLIEKVFSNYITYGDYDRALEISNTLIEIYKKVTIGLNNNLCRAYILQALAYRGLHDSENMIASSNLAISMDCGDEIHCIAYDIIGYGHFVSGNYDEAEKYLIAAISHNSDIDPYIVDMCYKDLSLLYIINGDYAQATKYASKITHNSLEEELLIAWQSGNLRQTEKHIKAYYDWLVKNIIDVSSSLSNEQFTTFAHNRLDWDILSSIATSFPNSTECLQIAYNSVINFKGVSLRTGREMTQYIRCSGIPTLNDKLDQIISMQNALNQESNPNDMLSLKNSIDAAETELYALLHSFEGSPFLKIYNWTDVLNRLGDNDVAIEFVECNSLMSEPCYVAMILRKGWNTPRIIKLCNKDELFDVAKIDPSSRIYRNSEDGKQRLDDIYYKKGYSLIWSKISDYLHDSDRIYFAPDGLLHQINIEIFQDNIGMRLSDKYVVHRLSSTRELCIDKKQTSEKSIILYGGLDYDMNVQSMISQSRQYKTTRDRGILREFANGSTSPDSWSNLPGTKIEVERISELCKQYNISADIYTSKDGNEESFKALSGKNVPIIHIATHGLFVDDNPTDHAHFLGGCRSDNSFGSSALIFSGANNIWSGKAVPDGVEDGVLLAEEIATMNLTETELVVLSACETGLGKITSEGVFGLQRAFKKAGVQTIIMSLWKVDDAATSMFMQSFYKHWLAGASKHDAFELAQETVRSYPEKDWQSPYFWAGFIMLD